MLITKNHHKKQQQKKPQLVILLQLVFTQFNAFYGKKDTEDLKPLHALYTYLSQEATTIIKSTLT